MNLRSKTRRAARPRARGGLLVGFVIALAGSSLAWSGCGSSAETETGSGVSTMGGMGGAGGEGGGGVACGPGTTLCGEACVTTANDPLNCGGCDNACAPGEVCSVGQCGLQCAGGTTKCGNACVTTTSDPLNCGNCDNACAPGEVCSAGQCGVQCAGGTTQCGSACVTTASDPLNCGNCAKPCAPGEVCSAGQCGLQCAGGATQCGDLCVSTASDPANCGGCNNACASGEVCSAGQCGLQCAGGTTKCGNLCVSPASDPANCGACGNACAPGEVCSAGQCGVQCAGGTTKCGNACVTPASDPANCGACGNACAPGEVCSAGQCGVQCGGGTTKCGNACVATATDPANCGACGNACAPGEACSAGQCGLQCQGGTTQCGNVCTNTAFDPANCGGCGTACPGAPNAAATCAQGSCSFACAAPFQNCNLNAADGCEVNTSNNVMSCGSCGTACAAPANAAPACSNGVCGLGACNAGFANCDANPQNGCEANTSNNKNNCGGCGIVCPGNQACSAGACVVAGCYGPLAPVQTIQLAAAWSGNTDTNFHPQGMTYDEAAGNLVLALQGGPQLRVVSLAGVLLNTISLAASGMNSFDYLTGIAADANFYYLTDYTCNANCPDLFRVAKAGGAPTQISNEISAYGGYPIAIGGGKIYRGEIINNTYDWTNINQIRVSDLATPDVVTQTHTIALARGIGDLTWDGSALWALGYSNENNPNRNVDLLRIDPVTGAVLETYLNVYNPGAPYTPSGLAYAQGHLYVLNYSETSGVGSTLTKLACQ